MGEVYCFLLEETIYFAHGTNLKAYFVRGLVSTAL